MTLLLLKKYKYIGQHPTRVSAVPYAPAVELNPEDEVVSQIRLPSHLFKEIPLNAEEALVHIGGSLEKQDTPPKVIDSRDDFTIPQLVEILKANSIEIPSGTKKKSEFIALLEANSIEIPKTEA